MDKKGQALVETALLFPLFIFVVLVYFLQLAFYYDALVLQASAARWARQNALEPRYSSTVARSLLITQDLIGRVQPPRFSRNTVRMDPNRIFVGVEVVQTGGSVVTGQVQSRLLPQHFFNWFVPSLPVYFSAEFPMDPPIPEAE